MRFLLEGSVFYLTVKQHHSVIFYYTILYVRWDDIFAHLALIKLFLF